MDFEIPTGDSSPRCGCLAMRMDIEEQPYVCIIRSLSLVLIRYLQSFHSIKSNKSLPYLSCLSPGSICNDPSQ